MTNEHEADVLAERHDGVLLLRLNRPHRHNAIGGTLLRDLSAAFDEAAASRASGCCAGPYTATWPISCAPSTPPS